MAGFRSYVKWLLFFSSYTPLFFVLAFKHYTVQYTIGNYYGFTPSYLVGISIPYASLFWISSILVSLIFLYLSISIRTSREPTYREFESPKSRNDLITNYILVYIFPFVVLDYSQPINWLTFIVFFFVIGIIQVRANQLHINPILALARYEVYEAEFESRNIMVLSKKRQKDLERGVNTIELSNNVHLTV